MASTVRRLQSLGPYEVIDLLGEGGMARVYRARQMILDREVALKILPSEQVGDGQERSRFLREAKALARINHPNVVTCFEAGQHDDLLYMAMELLESDALKLLREHGGRMGEERALEVIRDVAAGLEALEKSGLVHRDIKPSNIFITIDGTAKLADLGLVQSTSDAAASRSGLRGTPTFMSPEQVAGLDLDIRSDIYALGATLFALWAGQPPFTDDSMVEVMRRIVREDPPDLAKMRPDLAESSLRVVRRSLCRNRERRFPDARLMRVACEEALEALRSHSDRTDEVAVVPEEPPPDPSGTLVAIDPQTKGATANAIGRLAKRLHTDELGLRAWINLAPEVALPYAILEQVLRGCGVVEGWREEAIAAAARSTGHARRLVLAEGVEAAPGRPGRNVFGAEIPPPAVPVIVQVSGDQLRAVALFEAGCRPSLQDLRQALDLAGVVCGIDEDVLEAIAAGRSQQPDRAVVARGRPPRAERAPGFQIVDDEGGATDLELSALHPVQVGTGTIIARWRDGEEGRPGIDVLGRVRKPPTARALSAEDQAGPGTVIDDEGAVLRAGIAGFRHVRPDGSFAVLPAEIVRGDLRPGESVAARDLVVVQGSVLAGAHINSGGDVVVQGDLEDACIEAGGSLRVGGGIAPGVAEIIAGGSVEVAGDVARHLISGSLRVGGTARACDLLCTGDAVLERVIGGRVVAGGDVVVACVGDDQGTTTELVAGRHLGYRDQLAVARQIERQLAGERERWTRAVHQLADQAAQLRSRHDLHHQADWRSDQALIRHRMQIRKVERAQELGRTRAEAARQQLEAHRVSLAEVRAQAVDVHASILVEVEAHRGVLLTIGDSRPLYLRERRGRFRFKLPPPLTGGGA